MKKIKTEIVVLGGGPGGYTAAFRAADLGKQVIIVEERATLGGVCLNEGCIPSKALLHMAKVIEESTSLEAKGVSFGPLRLDIRKIRDHKDSVVSTLTKGLAKIAEKRGVRLIQGKGSFTGSHSLTVEGAEVFDISFDDAIIASGSRVIRLPLFPFDDPRVMDSTDALDLKDIPDSLLIVGGGIIGLEMATIYSAMGSDVTVVELTDQIIPPADKDLIRPLLQVYKKRLKGIMLSTRVTGVEPNENGLLVSFEKEGSSEQLIYDKILVCVGRRPNTDNIGLEVLGLDRDKGGFLDVNLKRQTSLLHIYGIGDITGQPMLAHKAVHEGKVAAESLCGLPAAFDPLCIPSVAYTDPEVAWTGLTEKQALQEGIAYDVSFFPWAASGRSLSLGSSVGRTKVLFDRDKKIIGFGIVGTNADELIGEGVLALEMGADLMDMGLMIHAHPTLSETIGLAAEVGEGTITDL